MDPARSVHSRAAPLRLVNEPPASSSALRRFRLLRDGDRGERRIRFACDAGRSAERALLFFSVARLAVRRRELLADLESMRAEWRDAVEQARVNLQRARARFRDLEERRRVEESFRERSGPAASE